MRNQGVKDAFDVSAGGQRDNDALDESVNPKKLRSTSTPVTGRPLRPLLRVRKKKKKSFCFLFSFRKSRRRHDCPPSRRGGDVNKRERTNPDPTVRKAPLCAVSGSVQGRV